MDLRLIHCRAVLERKVHGRTVDSIEAKCWRSEHYSSQMLGRIHDTRSSVGTITAMSRCRGYNTEQVLWQLYVGGVR